MRVNAYIHFDTDEEIPIDVRNTVAGDGLVLDIKNLIFFFEHWQLLDLRDKINAALAVSPMKCHFPGCEEEHEGKSCMSCDGKPCTEHRRVVFCSGESDEVDGYHCDPVCPAKKEKAA